MDPAQIPPVGKLHSIPLSKSISRKYEEGYTLTQIMRQAEGHPIIEASFAIRDNLSNPEPIPNLESKIQPDMALFRFRPDRDRDILMGTLNTLFTCDNFKANPDFAKVIAWRNKTIDTVNKVIREFIYPGQVLTKVMIGEKVLANKPIFDEEKTIIFTTSEEFSIKGFTIVDKKLRFGGLTFEGKFYVCNTSKGEKIRVLHEESEASYAKFLDDLKNKAIKSKDSKVWVEFYKAMKYPADLAYNYAITAHKSQGSTYRNVVILEDDIDANRNIVERNRIKYTAYSRASTMLYIYKS